MTHNLGWSISQEMQLEKQIDMQIELILTSHVTFIKH